MPLKPLPIDAVIPDALQRLQDHGALVLIAAPGAGKTTRIPPAVLDANLANLASGQPGQIVVLQPRRVAARSAAARISDERGTKLGQEIGYMVRHERLCSRDTRILVCTQGVFLRRLQDDPMLEQVSCVVFDEFHERTLDSDLALALVRQVRSALRPDLKIIVMSATLDATPVSKYLGDCPIIESAGRSYPVAIEHIATPVKKRIEESVAEAVKQMAHESTGHVLAFLPGLNEILRTQELLKTYAEDEQIALMPLHGEMPLESQQRVLTDKSSRKIILATNVAETSITIDGVTAVVDSGMSRINSFDRQLGLNRLNLARISRAAADQRAGRAGRTSSGKCLRLWTANEHLGLSEHTEPEITRVELSECVLQLLDWGESDLTAFGWFEAPTASALAHALALLERLGAIHHGLLTPQGKRMARMPLQPRLARLIIEGESLGQLRRATLCAALLSERDPIRRPPESLTAQHKSASDVLDRVWALEDYAASGQKHSIVGEINIGGARRIIQTSDQLFKQVVQSGEHKSGQDKSTTTHDTIADDAVRRMLLAAFPDRVCRRRQPASRQALMVGGRGVRLTDQSAVSDGELFIAVELVELGKSEASVRQASTIDKSWLPTELLGTTIDAFYDSSKQKVMTMKRTRFADLIIDETVAALPPEMDAGTILAQALASSADLEALVDDDARQYLARIACLQDKMPELGLPQFSATPWVDLLDDWCMGCSSLAELKAQSFLAVIQAKLTHQQRSEIEREAPERMPVPSGNQIKLTYEAGKAPVLAVRIQELFGMIDTPKIARNRQPVLVHLLAPNYRVQQITPDLASFWKNTYPEVKKDLKARYPKHSWPDDPLIAQAERGPKRKRPT
ncbi:MAG: ATP-dependent helicase HrpB [Cyanobacteriota bacterium erpe_2018_sw_39hr_WHONDRS-SW48-000098_B_bin.30]|jgi:ATP-dependent helicase HrpB|nr:ATP-dependent helicase HrpB [Cyanobacteriota bacterium erpe_2018_sw_39hr_WHONDRS-SW48-000098_B_bin.30]